MTAASARVIELEPLKEDVAVGAYAAGDEAGGNGGRD
jgi:hypothetical protein